MAAGPLRPDRIERGCDWELASCCATNWTDRSVSGYRFTDEERFAVHMVHGQKCYLCGEPVNLMSPIDHIIPESLAGKPDELAAALDALGLPRDFDVNDYPNWAPSCTSCNSKKSDRLWKPSLLVQQQLQIVEERAPVARKLASETLTEQKVTRSINTVLRAINDGQLEERHIDMLRPVLEVYVDSRPAEADDDALRLDNRVTVPLKVLTVDDATGLAIVNGPYGIGGGVPGAPSHMRCVCGSPYFNGPRCVLCGQMMDD